MESWRAFDTSETRLCPRQAISGAGILPPHEASMIHRQTQSIDATASSQVLQNVARNIISSMRVGKIIETERPFRATAKLAAFYLPARPNLGDQSIPPLA